MATNMPNFVLFVTLLILFLVIPLESAPVMKSGYTKNHHMFRQRQSNLSPKAETEEGFWSNVYFVLTATDSFFGG
ncbi:hypothetical protein GCK72_016958 [Caenorhabditis remanei]|uniref:Uncharacterized protein n=1 Tax=Caenorhabditis remanei TaxID=31234 RepID=A0A6A5G5U8_CAERE|nr:hypothetical protein GCK72_016958 [Caenorhabditis remanei]KAF1750408.1 hypothetical protein GCK72_016958 [Caenorhabditis remanei]